MLRQPLGQAKSHACTQAEYNQLHNNCSRKNGTSHILMRNLYEEMLTTRRYLLACCIILQLPRQVHSIHVGLWQEAVDYGYNRRQHPC